MIFSRARVGDRRRQGVQSPARQGVCCLGGPDALAQRYGPVGLSIDSHKADIREGGERRFVIHYEVLLSQGKVRCDETGAAVVIQTVRAVSGGLLC